MNNETKRGKKDNDLDLIKTTRRSGKERFVKDGKPLAFNLLDFWKWSASDLLGNTSRGVLAEYIVAQDMGIADDVASEWAPYDLRFLDIKIEVKSGAYLQSWKQTEYSKIVFGIAPRRAWDSEINKMSDEVKRQSDVYVFCFIAI